VRTALTANFRRFSESKGGHGHGARTVIYRFTLCERGGVEIASCRLTCDAEFADGFERGMELRIDDETQYIVREAIDESETAPGNASGPLAAGDISATRLARSPEKRQAPLSWRTSRPAPSA
jgi:hypothetical protein